MIPGRVLGRLDPAEHGAPGRWGFQGLAVAAETPWAPEPALLRGEWDSDRPIDGMAPWDIEAGKGFKGKIEVAAFHAPPAPDSRWSPLW